MSLKNVGTGIMRALELESGMTMVNDVELQEFVVTFIREWNGEGDGRVDRVPYKEFPAQDRLDDDNLTSEKLWRIAISRT